MTFLKLAIRSLIYYWRIHATVALGVAAATAVLIGALVVGDSVRGSLRGMTLDRLGRIHELLLSDRFFRTSLADQLPQQAEFPQDYQLALGLMLFPQATAERPGDGQTTRATNVLVVGSETDARQAPQQTDFWSLGDRSLAPAPLPQPGEVVLNRRLADELQVKVGDQITLRLPKPESIPADSPLGEKTDRIRSLPQLMVVAIVENRGLGRFSLHPSQSEPLNAFVSLRQLQDALDQKDRINALLVAGPDVLPAPADEASQALAAALKPSLEDLGLTITHPRLSYTSANGDEVVVYDYFSVSSDRMILPAAVERAAARALGPLGGHPVLTYLANVMEPVVAGDSPTGIPYSMVTAIDPTNQFTLLDAQQQPIGRLGDSEIVLTSWAADDLGVGPGDEVRLTYFEPETRGGASEESSAVLRVRAITPLTAPSEPFLPSQQHHFIETPTLANDPDLTPKVEGITDQRSIDDWEVPFTIDYSLIRPADDQYWEEYATTPKAFVSLATGRRLWGSRFGATTSFRVPATGQLTQEEVERRLMAELLPDKATLGFAFRPLKRQQLAASAGNTPFDWLFLALSFFVIAAALMLVLLLQRLGFEQRAQQVGLLLSVGWNRRQVRHLLIYEGLAVSLIGSALGVLIGLGYAGLILAALHSKAWWLGAISTPFLEFHWTTRSLVMGYVSGTVVSVLTIAWSVWRTRHVPARQLLAGRVAAAASTYAAPARWPLLVALLLVSAAVGLAFWAFGLTGEQQAGSFVGSGAMLLTALLIWCWHALRQGGRHLAPLTRRAPLVMLAARSAARNPTRSTLTIGLIATASFLIVAMSAFRLKPTETGTGGFALIAELSQPIFADFRRPPEREELLGDEAAAVLRGSDLFTFRVRPGDNAGCGNLYRAQQPRILGVPPALVERFDDPDAAGFAFAAAADSPQNSHNPWHVLSAIATPSGEPIPVVLDKDTALYSLQLLGGIGQEFTFVYDDRPITFRVAGLLALSVLHGNLLISEADFRQLFPDINGYRFALVTAPAGQAEQVAEVLEDRLSDQGFDALDTRVVLSGLMALQNTYLRTFQMLGALGLLLGTFGLAAVQLRSVLERRGEMGLLRAAGFRRSRLAQLVLLENLFLLLAGLAAGVLAALAAVLPHMFRGGAAVPFAELAMMLVLVLLVGMAAGYLASQATLRVPVLAALREER